MRALLSMIWLAASASGAAGPQDTPLRLGEGPLDNAAFLPLDEGATSALARADALHAALEGVSYDESSARRWREVFDLWHVALRDAAVGAVCPALPSAGGAQASRLFDDPDGTAAPAADRRRDGVEAVVLRRVLRLDAATRAAWTRAQAPLAEEARTLAQRRPTQLAEVERRFPATLAAARSALELCDLEFEAARPRIAARWLERARLHSQSAPDAPASFTRALDERAQWIAGESAPPSGAPPLRLMDATRLEPAGMYVLEDGRRRGGLRARSEPGLFVRPGLAFLDDKRALVHFATSEQSESLALYDFELGLQVARTDLTQLLRDRGLAVGPLLEALEPPGWPLAIATAGDGAVLTVGRRGSSRGNALVCLELGPNIDPQGPPLLRLRWLWFDGRQLAGPGLASEGASGRFDACEFQPGVAVDAERVLVTVREYDLDEQAGDFNARESSSAQIRTWVAALDLTSGALVHRTWLGRGLEIQRSAGRFFGARSPAASSAPIAVANGRALITSHTGFSALVDALDGRVLWALRTRRRPSEERRWTGGPAFHDAGERAWALAPADSDQLYWLRDDADLDGAGLFRAPPRESDEASILLGAAMGEALVLAPHGPQRALASWNARSGRTLTAAYLGSEETFGGEGLVADGRALFSTSRGLCLIDLQRELYLLDYAALERSRAMAAAGASAGGTVFAAGEWACVLGANALWVFRLR